MKLQHYSFLLFDALNFNRLVNGWLYMEIGILDFLAIICKRILNHICQLAQLLLGLLFGQFDWQRLANKRVGFSLGLFIYLTLR
ncbi:MAG: hypothetical protein ABW121_17235, partial [Candidatus Thiodiazotropha sp. 6PLUC7]